MENKFQCSCGNWIFIKEEVNKGTIIKCPKCGKSYRCIDKNDYIERWREYNEKN